MQGELFVLLQINRGLQVEHLLSQLSWIAASLLVAFVCPVYLVDELILIFCNLVSHSGASGSTFDVFQHMVSMV